MYFAGDAEVHSFAGRHRNAHRRIGDADLNRAPAPTHCKRHAAPGWWQSRIQADRFAGKVETCEAADDCQPDAPQPSDAYAAGTVGVQFKVCGCGFT